MDAPSRERLNLAKFFATTHHVHFKRQMYGALPYTHHLQAVEETIVEFVGEDIDLMVAAWLHDIVEDTDVELRDIEETFGENTARLVGAVTSEPGPNRKMRNTLTYPKIRKAGADAVTLKLGDRIANVRYGGGAAMLKKYKDEHAEFREALYRPNENDVMWRHLDTLVGYY